MQVISRNECTILRGIAILGIILHNFCSKLPGAVEENEFYFKLESPIQLLHEICHPTMGLLSHLFSFFGHYGVAMFVFLSGYGLAVKYEQSSSQQATFKTFFLHNLTKFWKYYIPGTIIYLVIYVPMEGWLPIHLPLLSVQSLFLANLIPSAVMVPYIYWYFGMAMQLYVVYWVCLRNRSAGMLFVIAAFQITVQYAVFTFFQAHAIGLMAYFSVNCGSWLMLFAAGIYIARYGYPKIMRNYRKTTIALLIAIFLLGQVIDYLWPFAALCIVGLNVLIASRLNKSVLGKYIYRVGILSAIIFVAQPTTRAICLRLRPDIDSYLVVAFFVAFTLGAAWLTHKLIPKISSIFVKR